MAAQSPAWVCFSFHFICNSFHLLIAMKTVDLGGSLAVASKGLFATGVSTDLNGEFFSPSIAAQVQYLDYHIF